MDVIKQDTLETSGVEYAPPGVEYAPYDESTQLARYIKNYPRSFTRNPSQASD